MNTLKILLIEISLHYLFSTVANGSYNHFVYNRLTDINKWHSLVWMRVKRLPEATTIECGFHCSQVSDGCMAFATNTQNNCILLNGWQELADAFWTNSDEDWKVFVRENVEIEMPVFRLSSGSGVKVYDAWVSGSVSVLSEVATSRDLDLSSPLTTFYKHPLVDDWQNWGVSQSIFSFYTNGKAVARVRFNGKNTNSTSWFSRENLLWSPWEDLKTSAPVNIFGVGHTVNEHSIGRRFYINSYFDRCSADTGWLVIFDEGDVCKWSTFSHYPVFRFALGNQSQKWSNVNKFGTGDELMISVLLNL